MTRFRHKPEWITQMDDLMSQVPGLNGHAMNRKTHKGFYYHRWYRHLGASQKHLPFSDETVYVAETTDRNVMPLTATCAGNLDAFSLIYVDYLPFVLFLLSFWGWVAVLCISYSYFALRDVSSVSRRSAVYILGGVTGPKVEQNTRNRSWNVVWLSRLSRSFR